MAMAVPRELWAAVTQAHDRELGEVDEVRRVELHARTMRTLDAWLRRRVTTADAVAALGAAALH
jgi:hypothetical protein